MNTVNELLPHVRLKFNIDHPGLEDCYLFGYECALAEVKEGDNPFAENSKEAEQWIEEHNNAMSETSKENSS